MYKTSLTGRINQQLLDIRSSLWFVPTLIVASAVALAFGLIEIDKRVDQQLRDWWPRVFVAEPEGTLAMLSTIAGSMATVAGVAFSITIVALALASGQYTSRVLRNFMRDPANQVVLGVFVGIYAYCLLVMRNISSGSNSAFVPSLAVLGGIALALVGIAVFIFFIHHIATSIQAEEIIASISRDTVKVIDRLFPQELGEEGAQDVEQLESTQVELTWYPVPVLTTGYIQSVDVEVLLAFARERNTVLRMEYGVGDFATQGRPLASLAVEQAPDEVTVRALNRIYAIDSYRTTDQDAVFGMRQLVDIALKALSPGINDATTAVACIEHLSVILQRCAVRRIESSYRFDHGELRVIAQGPTFERLVALAFNQILENAEGNTEIITRMLMAIGQVSEVTRSAQRRCILMQHLEVIAEVADRSAKSDYARRTIEEQLTRVRAI